MLGREIVRRYDWDRLSIATLASHSALQILHGAKREGFHTIVVGPRSRLEFYRGFSHFIDTFIEVDMWSDLCRRQVQLRLHEYNAIMVPHGSMVEYVGSSCVEELELPLFGLRGIVRVESNQYEKMRFLQDAGIPTPRIYRLDEGFNTLVIVKLPGAKGGRGYFLARTPGEVRARLEKLIEKRVIGSPDEAIIQEYVVGTPAYYHFFYSPVLDRLELLGADIRYESIVDGLRRLPPSMATGFEPSFVVVGNIPLVLRESILPLVYEYGLRFVKAFRERLYPGIIGPFSLESIITDELEVKVFEFSGRIVAGTNLYTSGSPYSIFYWDEPMSTGRRIAREVRLALSKGALELVVT